VGALLELVGDTSPLGLTNGDTEAQEALPDTLGLTTDDALSCGLLDPLVIGVTVAADVLLMLIIGVFVDEIDPLMDWPEALTDAVAKALFIAETVFDPL
jgi:hypothetical protein